MKLNLSIKTRSQIQKIFWITVAWTFISILEFGIGYATVLQMIEQFNVSIPIELNPLILLRGNILTGIIAGIIGGSGITLLWEEWLRNKTYGQALLGIFLSYVLIFIFITIFRVFYFSNQFDFDLTALEAMSPWERSWYFMNSIPNWINFIFWLLVVLGTLILLQVNDKYGTGVFRAFLMGKYFRPKGEERIFMFLDLRSSTTIAERLGENKYFNFLNDVFKHATPGILHNQGEIYQYVGDEIVISWSMEKGIKNGHCIQCFFDVQIALRQKWDYYQKNYGVQPEFKAGVHCGHVMAGEIGVVKRD
ncbi:MAG: adenylate/guanylate cyclase domain-containing protein, partial [Bacteroidota bacterium]